MKQEKGFWESYPEVAFQAKASFQSQARDRRALQPSAGQLFGTQSSESSCQGIVRALKMVTASRRLGEQAQKL